jgi:glycosyltransferase involved in cell wall biosynthesis
MHTLYVVVPCYNEEEVLPLCAPVLLGKLADLIAAGKVSVNSRILFVNDGSVDRTWELIRALHEENGCVDGVCLTRNRGHQNAVMAGLVTAIRWADVTITVDADLQDDIDAVDGMIDKYRAGAQVVCGVRSNRESDSALKRMTAQGYYRLMNLFGAKLIYNHADYRLLSREAVLRLCRFGTEDLFLRGLITRLGFAPEKVYYVRSPRAAGETKYTVKKMLHLAMRGMRSGRQKPADAPVIGELYIGEILHDE